MSVRSTGRRFGIAMGAALSVMGSVLVLVPGTASAATSVTTPWPPGNPADGQTVTVSGSGFPLQSVDPTGLQIYECADPGGTALNLPNSPSECDGTTVSGNQINTGTTGTFSTPYTISQVTINGTGSNINCDSTDYCVLWVGVDFNNAFTTAGEFGFSAPFEVGAPPALAPEAPVAIALPVAGALVIGGTFLVMRRRRNRSPAAA
jgi:hypothetical protein